MMNCERFKDWIFEYLAGELDALSLSEFRQHYERCPSCLPLLRTIESQETLLMALGRPKAPDTLWSRVQHGLDDRKRVDRLENHRRPVVGWIIATAAALLMAWGLFVTVRSAPPVPEISIRIVDVTAGPAGSALGRVLPGLGTGASAAPVLDNLVGISR